MKKTTVFSGLLTLMLAGVLFLRAFPVSAQAAGEEFQLYFGQLHSHSGYLDKISSPAQVFAGAKASGMDFFALTDYSHSFDNAQEGSIAADGSAVSETWREGKQAAKDAAGDGFLPLYGYEMAWYSDLRLGHISTYATPGWQCAGQDGFDDLTDYYAALASVPGAIGQFNHPGIQQGNFEGFAHHCWEYGQAMALLEVSGENGHTYYDQYQKALDKNWHVAPTASDVSHEGDWSGASQVRTGIWAASLTEDAIFDAIRARRVYATEDADLSVHFSLGGHFMGSRVTETVTCQADIQLADPTDSIGGTVEVVTADGTVLASQSAEPSMSLSLPAGYPYYYLRITQADGDVAVTAPVWVETADDLGISSFAASAQVPVQGEELELSFQLFNHEPETAAFSAVLFADGEEIWRAGESMVLSSGESRLVTVPYTHPGVGITDVLLQVSGTIGGQSLSFEETLQLSFRPAMLNAHILVDGRHNSISYDSLENLTALAASVDMDLAIFRDETPQGAKVLIVPAPTRDFSETYPQLLANFVENGGHLILCGQPGDNSQLNTLLSQLGSTMAFHHDTARDPVHNGGTPEQLHPNLFNETASCWEHLTEEQFYTHRNGCTIDPGSGTWLVKGKDTMLGDSQVLLATESLGQGQVTIAGSFFLDDLSMPQPKNDWDPPRANQLLMEAILNIQRPQLPVSQIQAVRAGEQGEIFRVKGYVTAGTSKEYNRFPELIYLQDDTGGIGITRFTLPDIETGFCLDIVGQLTMDGENPALKLVSCRIIPDDLYRHDPEVSLHYMATDYEHYGGQLMKIEGIAGEIHYTEDFLGVSRFTLWDELGDPATVLIEDYILSGTYGVNRLANQVMEGKAVRAYGILHREADGTPVLRVRNCDEVVHIPPIPERPEEKQKPDLSNPPTGDPLYFS